MISLANKNNFCFNTCGNAQARRRMSEDGFEVRVWTVFGWRLAHVLTGGGNKECAWSTWILESGYKIVT